MHEGKKKELRENKGALGVGVDNIFFLRMLLEKSQAKRTYAW